MKTIFKLLLATILLFSAIEITAQVVPTGSPNTTRSYTYTSAFPNMGDLQNYQALRMILAAIQSGTTTGSASVVVTNTPLPIGGQTQDNIVTNTSLTASRLSGVATAVNQTLNTAAVNVLKSKLDTVTQNQRAMFNRMDTTNRFITVTYTWTTPTPSFVSVVGNAATNSTLTTTSFSVAIPQTGTWKIVNAFHINNLYAPVNVYVLSNTVTAGPNNTLTTALVPQMNNTIGYIPFISIGAGMNGYVGQVTSTAAFRPIPVRGKIDFLCSYATAANFNSVVNVVTFILEK